MTTRKRRGAGEGSVYLRKDGYWCGAFSSGGRLDRRRVVVTGKTKAEVLAKLDEARRKGPPAGDADERRQPLADFLGRWLEGRREDLRQTTLDHYAMLAERYVCPALGRLPLAKVTPAEVERFKRSMERQGLSGGTRHAAFRLLRACLDVAVRWARIDRNPCRLVDAPRKGARAAKHWTAEEARRFLTAAKDHRLYALFVVALTTGLRRGELVGLQWRDIDLGAGALAVQRTVSVSRDGAIVCEPKTAKGRRRVALPAMAVEALRAHRTQARAGTVVAGPWVFVGAGGNHVNPNHLGRDVFHGLRKRAGLPHIRFHDLRHTAASLLLSLGVHPKVVQEMLGHSSIAITMDLYSHVLPSMQDEAAAKMDRLLGS